MLNQFESAEDAQEAILFAASHVDSVSKIQRTRQPPERGQQAVARDGPDCVSLCCL
jgi:hypothetical protein